MQVMQKMIIIFKYRQMETCGNHVGEPIIGILFLLRNLNLINTFVKKITKQNSTFEMLITTFKNLDASTFIPIYKSISIYW